MLSNTLLGVGVVLEVLGCTSVKWSIWDAEEGNIGSGSIGSAGAGEALLLDRRLRLGVVNHSAA